MGGRRRKRKSTVENATSSFVASIFEALSRCGGGIFFNRLFEAKGKVEKKHTEIARKMDRALTMNRRLVVPVVLSFGGGSYFYKHFPTSLHLCNGWPVVLGFSVYLSHKTKFVSLVQLGHRESEHQSRRKGVKDRRFIFMPSLCRLLRFVVMQWAQSCSHECTDELLEVIFGYRLEIIAQSVA